MLFRSVEYANQLKEQGLNTVKAAIKAGQERFRPILMTAISSLVGFYPLVVATGAGASSRWSLGTAVFGGMLFATALTLFLVPSLYIIIKGLESLIKKDNDRDSGDSGGNNGSGSNYYRNNRVKSGLKGRVEDAKLFLYSAITHYQKPKRQSPPSIDLDTDRFVARNVGVVRQAKLKYPKGRFPSSGWFNKDWLNAQDEDVTGTAKLKQPKQ